MYIMNMLMKISVGGMNLSFYVTLISILVWTNPSYTIFVLFLQNMIIQFIDSVLKMVQ